MRHNIHDKIYDGGRMGKIYCTDFETMGDTVDILLAEGYRVTIRYSEVIIDNAQAYEITYAPDSETNTLK